MNLSPDEIAYNLGLLPGITVADFGSGSGHLAIALARSLGKEGKTIAIDLNPDMLVRLKNQADEWGLNIETICADVEEEKGTHLVEGAVNAVVISHTLPVLKEKGNVFAEARRILKNNGILALIEDESRMKEKEVKSYAEEAGFRYFSRFQAGENRYGILFKK